MVVQLVVLVVKRITV